MSRDGSGGCPIAGPVIPEGAPPSNRLAGETKRTRRMLIEPLLRTEITGQARSWPSGRLGRATCSQRSARGCAPTLA
jgi:hypothetical protein